MTKGIQDTSYTELYHYLPKQLYERIKSLEFRNNQTVNTILILKIYFKDERIHFVATINFDKTKLIFPEENVNLMYVFQDLNWKEANLVIQTNNEINETRINFE